MYRIRLTLILTVFLFLIQLATGYEYIDDENAVRIANTPFSFIYFFKDDCRFCQQFEATFDYIDLKLSRTGLPMYKIDGKANKKLSEMFRVTSYPSIRIYDTNLKEFHVYPSSDRTIKLITEFIELHTPFRVPAFQPPANLQYDESQVLPHSFVLSTSFYFDQYMHPLHYINNIAKDFPQTTVCVNNVLNTAMADWWKSLGAPTKFPSFTIVDDEGRYRMITGDHLDETKIRKFILESHNATDWAEVGKSQLDDFEVDEDEDDLVLHDEL